MRLKPNGFVDFGFWTETPGPPPTREERRLLAGKAKLMDLDIREAELKRQQERKAVTDTQWKNRCQSEYTAVVMFLEFPERRLTYGCRDHCPECKKPLGTFSVGMTKQFRFPSTLLHEVVEHGIKPPRELIEAALDYLVTGDTRPSIVCPTCFTESFNSTDIKERYCGHCHKFHDEMEILG